MMIRRLMRTGGAAALILTGVCTLAADLTVTVEGVKPGDGPVLIALFDKPDGFPAGRAKVQQMAEGTQAKVAFSFKDLPPGRYALSAFQDRNNNKRLDANMMGMPTELYGFSRDARGSFGPPKFDDAVLTLDAAPRQISFQLK